MVKRAAIGCAGYPCILNQHEVSLACHQPPTARLFFPPGLNAWCELHGEDLSGRCPQIRVGLPTSPEGKGAELLCSMWTPSSPYSTSSWMTSASLTPPNSDAPDRQPPSPRAKSSPWPSSLGGRRFPARGTSTAMLRPISEQHSLLSQTVPSSTVSCDSMPRTSRRSP